MQLEKYSYFVCYVVFLTLQMTGCQQGEKNGQIEVSSYKKELGHYLFFDKRLSITNTKSCSSCHDPQFAFTDGYRKPPGVYADLHFRNTPSLINVSSQKYFNRANPDITSIFEQMDQPLFGVHPIEMGLNKLDTTIFDILAKDPVYKSMFSKAYPEIEQPINWVHIKDALTAYVLTLNSYGSPYDQYKSGNRYAISDGAKAGEKLFFSTKFKCGTCHVLPQFGSDSLMPNDQQFANIGLYNIDNGNYPYTDQGLNKVTNRKEDRGKFKIPTLRNLAFTAPYFHDGSAETLHDVLDVYENGGRIINFGDWQGDGRANPHKSLLINGIKMSTIERTQLLDFLQTLNDSTISQNINFKAINTSHK